MKYTLLIWNACDKGIKLYLIPEEESKKYRDYLDQAHDRLINSDEMNDGMRFLNTVLAWFEGSTAEDGFESFLGIWAKYKVKNTASPILDTNITKVYVSGFVP